VKQKDIFYTIFNIKIDWKYNRKETIRRQN